MKDSRLDIRIYSKQKLIYQQYAKIKGVSLSALIEDLIYKDISNSSSAFLLKDIPKNNIKKMEQYADY